MKTFRYSLVCLILSAILLPSVILAEQSCSSATKVIPMESEDASASTLDNMRNKEGSLRFESPKMFESAKAKFKAGAQPENFCPSNCQMAETPQMIFKSVPNKYKTDYSDKEKCDRYLAKTKENPIKFSKSLPRGIDPISDWIGDFSQGNGDDGKKLYKECDGSCSPQYTYDIQINGDKLDVEADVVCGPARDKDDNMYTIAYSFVWSCKAKA